MVVLGRCIAMSCRVALCHFMAVQYIFYPRCSLQNLNTKLAPNERSSSLNPNYPASGLRSKKRTSTIGRQRVALKVSVCHRDSGGRTEREEEEEGKVLNFADSQNLFSTKIS